MAKMPESDPGAKVPDDSASRGWFSGRRGRPAVGEQVSARPASPPPSAKSRKTGLIGLFSGLMTLGVLCALVLVALFATGGKQFYEPGPLTAEKMVMIEKGSSSEEIVELLEREGVISRPGWLWGALLIRDVQSKFTSDPAASKRAKAGEYLFKPAVTMNDVIEIITSGRAVEHTITIPEGLTSEQIVERLKENELLAGDIAQIPVEGALLPDTYKITRGTSREALLARMQREQRRVLADVWAKRSKEIPLKSMRELVTLASIVEKETGKADERPRIASVFYNRLEKKMRLQSDPTIIYGIVGGKGILGRGLTRAEIDRPTPYNTYAINGLPPGPIANPGKAALEATANPSKVRDIFFVADGTGGHVFAETLEQHNRNVARWRQIEASRSGTAPALPTAPTPQNVPSSGERGALVPPTVPGAGSLGFAPAQRSIDAAIAPQPLPVQESVGSVAPRQPQRPATRPAPSQNFDLTTPKTVPSLN